MGDRAMRKAVKAPTEQERLNACRRHIDPVLRTACEQRDRLPVEESVALERQSVLDIVNRLRTIRGVEPVDADMIARADSASTGEGWYQKFAMHAAELVLDLSVWQKAES